MNKSVQLNELIKSKAFRILEIFMRFPSKEFSTNEIAKKTKFSKATLAKWLSFLKNSNLLELKKIGAAKLYKLNKDAVIVRYLKILQSLFNLRFLKNTAEEYNCEIFLFGSVARGEENEKSDIDLLVISDKYKEAIVKEIQKYENILGKKLKLQVFDKSEWAEMERKDKAFYERVEKDKIKIN